MAKSDSLAPAPPAAALSTWQTKGFPKDLKYADFAQQLSPASRQDLRG